MAAALTLAGRSADSTYPHCQYGVPNKCFSHVQIDGYNGRFKARVLWPLPEVNDPDAHVLENLSNVNSALVLLASLCPTTVYHCVPLIDPFSGSESAVAYLIPRMPPRLEHDSASSYYVAVTILKQSGTNTARAHPPMSKVDLCVLRADIKAGRIPTVT